MFVFHHWRALCVLDMERQEVIQEGTAVAVLLCGPAPSPLQLVRADGSDVNLAEMEWHGGAKIFHGVMTNQASGIWPRVTHVVHGC